MFFGVEKRFPSLRNKYQCYNILVNYQQYIKQLNFGFSGLNQVVEVWDVRLMLNHVVEVREVDKGLHLVRGKVVLLVVKQGALSTSRGGSRVRRVDTR